VQAIKEIGGIIQQINQIASAIAAAIEEQGAATKEIARNVEQASVGTSEVSNHIVGVTKAANETGTAAGTLLTASSNLSDQATTLSKKVEEFLARIRQN